METGWIREISDFFRDFWQSTREFHFFRPDDPKILSKRQKCAKSVGNVGLIAFFTPDNGTKMWETKHETRFRTLRVARKCGKRSTKRVFDPLEWHENVGNEARNAFSTPQSGTKMWETQHETRFRPLQVARKCGKRSTKRTLDPPMWHESVGNKARSVSPIFLKPMICKVLAHWSLRVFRRMVGLGR